MKFQSLLVILGILGATTIVPRSSYAEEINQRATFVCNTEEDTIIARTVWGVFNIVRWEQTQPPNFFGQNWTPSSRCMRVAEKLQDHYLNNRLDGFISGTFEGYTTSYPIVCIGASPCTLSLSAQDRLLFMLQPGQEVYSSCVAGLLNDMRFVGREIFANTEVESISSQSPSSLPDRCNSTPNKRAHLKVGGGLKSSQGRENQTDY